MSAQADLGELAQEINAATDGRVTVTPRPDFINLDIQGVTITGDDTSKSDGATFATLDDPVSHVPDTIVELATQAGYDVTVLGHQPGDDGTGSLHAHVR